MKTQIIRLFSACPPKPENINANDSHWFAIFPDSEEPTASYIAVGNFYPTVETVSALSEYMGDREAINLAKEIDEYLHEIWDIEMTHSYQAYSERRNEALIKAGLDPE